MKTTGNEQGEWAMVNPWKLATIGIALVTVTALSTSLTTAYFLRDPAQEGAPAASAPRVTATQATYTPAVYSTPAPRPALRPAPRPVAQVRPVAVNSYAPTECDTGSGRAWKIAKPGIVGTLLGVGLGAVSGAVADGGRAAGKGALIGGIAGAVLGGGYGAYQTNKECGTIFGTNTGVSPAEYSAVPPGVFEPIQAALR